MAIGLKELLPSFVDMKAIGTHKGLAKLGDAVTNLIYSIAKSRLLRYLDARTVSRTMLSDALWNSGLRPYAKNRADSHDLADTAESFIGYCFCVEGWTIDFMVEILNQSLANKNITEERDEIKAASEAFAVLLVKIRELLTPKFKS